MEQFGQNQGGQPSAAERVVLGLNLSGLMQAMQDRDPGSTTSPSTTLSEEVTTPPASTTRVVGTKTTKIIHLPGGSVIIASDQVVYRVINQDEAYARGLLPQDSESNASDTLYSEAADASPSVSGSTTDENVYPVQFLNSEDISLADQDAILGQLREGHSAFSLLSRLNPRHIHEGIILRRMERHKDVSAAVDRFGNYIRSYDPTSGSFLPPSSANNRESNPPLVPLPGKILIGSVAGLAIGTGALIVYSALTSSGGESGTPATGAGITACTPDTHDNSGQGEYTCGPDKVELGADSKLTILFSGYSTPFHAALGETILYGNNKIIFTQTKQPASETLEMTESPK